MKNADLPAYPVHYVDYSCGIDGNEGPFLVTKSDTGLTKREMFAMAAMQGICSNPDDRYTYEQMAGHAVKHADALLAKLDETKS